MRRTVKNIPLSPERQKAVIEDQIDEIVTAIREAKEEDGDNFTVKQMEKTKKKLEAKLEKLAAKEKKDSVVTFEELGISAGDHHLGEETPYLLAAGEYAYSFDSVVAGEQHTSQETTYVGYVFFF